MASGPRDAALHIVETLREHGHVAYFAGGCVRDELLGLTPKDFDVATNAAPEVVQRLFPRSSAVGAAFGVVLVYTSSSGGRITTEVATFRTDGHYTDGRRPDAVTFTDAKHDAQRRDFTLNALFLDPTPSHADAVADAEERRKSDEASGTPPHILDFVHGLPDLHAGVIRAVGDPSQRLAEDYLRMLRAVRFAARFGFTIEPRTADAIVLHARRLQSLARERIGDECQRMLGELSIDRAARAAKLLQSSGLADAIFDQDLSDVAQPDVLAALPDDAEYPTRLVAWLPSFAPARFREALCLSNDHTDAIRDVRQVLHALPTLLDQPIAKRKRTYAHRAFPAALMILHADAEQRSAEASGPSLETDRHALAHDGIGLAPPPLLTGDHLVNAGYTPGPNFRDWLDAAYDAQLEGRITTRDEALNLVHDQRRR